jgi:hypothetical protein
VLLHDQVPQGPLLLLLLRWRCQALKRLVGQRG